MYLTQTGWIDYELLDAGEGKKLEKYGDVVLERPCREAQFSSAQGSETWKRDAFFDETAKKWQSLKQLPSTWPVRWQDCTFMAECAPYKHTGIFPEQSAHWQWMRSLLTQRAQHVPATDLHVLNLFAYTGCASVVAAKTGAKVTHVDSSRAAIGSAKLNQASSGLSDRSIRWILDDVVTFVQREVRRGVRYDGIIIDPPPFGHGPKGERWQLTRSLPGLLGLCSQLLTAQPLFVLLNVYTEALQEKQLYSLVAQSFKQNRGRTETGELCLETTDGKRQISTGSWARWEPLQ